MELEPRTFGKPLRAFISILSVQKAGNQKAEYEDAASCSDGSRHVDGEFEGSSLRVAIADGASESVLAGRWARLLVDRFAFAPQKWGLTDVAQDAVSAWPESVSQYVKDREEAGRPIAWYEEPGLMRGAYATLLGVRFLDRPTQHVGTWRAWAIGDSCIFQVREDQLKCTFPMTRSEDFGSVPALLRSREFDASRVKKHVERITGTWVPGDSFYLVTDALAAWFLRSIESGEEPWRILRDLETDALPAGFSAWVDDLRLADRLHNDDVTLIRVDVL